MLASVNLLQAITKVNVPLICVHSLNNCLINPKHLDFLATDKANYAQTIRETLSRSIKRMKINIDGGYSVL
jgi:hypothetical protein